MMLFIFFVSLIFFVSTDYVPKAMQNFYCDLGLRNNDLCPIDGGWTSWSSWGSCFGKCGFKGKKKRQRVCNNPLPSNNGASCIGPSYQIESCQIMGCTMDDYEKVVSIHPIRKKELKIVKDIHQKLPALIELCFLVDCTYFIVEKILGNNAMLYWNSMNCVKYDVGCPSLGGWSTWGIWSPCTAICGRGQKYRTRICNSPVPSNSKLMCDDSAFEMKSCVGVNCRKHLTGVWTAWDKWSACSVQCGSGIQVRKRSCSEIQNAQGISCKGSSKEIRGCAINNCSINGMWSSWTVWTPCTSSCGIGTQLRNRMCNNPSPSGNGTVCLGSASEVRQCFTKPCIVKLHEVAHFTEKSNLLYDINGRSLRMLHMYVRFLTLSPFGMIIHRFEKDCEGTMCNFVKLFLQNGKVVVLSQISGCSLGLIYESKLEIGQWHVILNVIHGTHGVLRVNNGYHKVSTFSCIPISYNLDHAMRIGEGFQGQIHEIAINFASIQLHVSKEKYDEKRVYAPSSSNNVQYLFGDDNEGFIYVGLTDSVAIPCPRKMEHWQIKIAIKIEDINGVIAFIPDDSLNKYILLILEEGKIKLKCYQGAAYVATENMEHILIGEWFEVVIAQDGKNIYMQVNGNEKKYIPAALEKITTDIFLGAIRDEMKEKVCSSCAEIPQMSFTLGYLDIDGNQIDLISLPVLETTSNRFSSRTISISDYYEEVPVLLGQELKLSCFYNAIPHEKGYAFSKKTYATWLLLDKLLQSYGEK
ncbi:Coadhesin (Fragment) [Anthophora quadrimaculata]